MDKFGIFNLLSSLFGGVLTDKGENGGAYNSPSPKESYNSDTAIAEGRAKAKPLQNSMLLTMKNHDEFIKRVQENNKKP